MNRDILFLSHRIPYPPNKGDKIRAHALVEHLAQTHTVHLGCFVDDPADFVHMDAVRRLAKGECLFVPLSRRVALARGLLGFIDGSPITTGYFGSGKIDAWVKHLIANRPIDRAFVFGSAMAPYLLRRREFDLAHSILDLVDVDSDKWRQYANASNWPRTWIYRREAAALARLERNAAGRFGRTILVSPYEARTFADMVPQIADRIHSVGNGVDLVRFAPGIPFERPFPKGERPIVMTGAMDYWPNVQGALWFAKMVMPLVVRRIPRARFYIVGGNPSPRLKTVLGPHVALAHAFGDVRPHLAHAEVAVAPLLIARGVQNKVLEAMAMEKPVVATWEATRALAVTAGVELWIANDAAQFAAAVVDAMEGPDRTRIAANGRRYVERSHRWSKNLAELDRLLDAGQSGPLPQTDAIPTMGTERLPVADAIAGAK
jgi:sugar transferase (PEP-CTERM/EpsH1 system associated)